MRPQGVFTHRKPMIEPPILSLLSGWDGKFYCTQFVRCARAAANALAVCVLVAFVMR
jgi:hypothetical protein